MDGSRELQSNLPIFNPADNRFQRVELVNLHPHVFIQIRALNKIDLTAVRRDVVQLYAMLNPTATAKDHVIDTA